MRRTRIFGIQLIALTLVIALPHLAHAATTTFLGPIFPSSCNCTNSAPDFGCILQLIQNVINFAVSFSLILVTIYIAWAGIGYMTNPTSPEARSKGNARIINAVLGLLIVLCSYLLVDTLMKVVYNSTASGTNVAQLGPWNSILSDTNPNDQCIKISSSATVGALVNSTGNAATGGTASNAPLAVSGSGACNAQNIVSAVTSEGGTISNSDANVLACLAHYESSCGTVNQNYNWGKGSSAYGPFQMTLQGNASYFNNAVCEKAVNTTSPLNCQTGFSAGNPIPGSTVASECEQAAANLGCSAVAASALYDKGGISAWTADSNSSGQGSCG